MVFTIKRGPTVVSVSPWPRFLERHLSYRKVVHSFGRSAGGRTGMSFVVENLFIKDGDSGMFPAGLCDKVLRLIKAEHPAARIEIEDYRRLQELMPIPDFSRIDELRPGQDEILLAVASSCGGLLVGGCGLGKTFLITQICRMYPTLNIVILSPRVSVVKTIYSNLTACLPSTAVAMIGGGSVCREKRRITVATTRSALKCDLKNCDLLLFDEAHNVGSNQIAEHLGYVERARRFGFTATPAGRSDGADLVMEAVFGPKLADIPYQDAVKNGLVTPIEVRVVDVVSSEYIPDSEMMTTRKRWNYWRNKSRNQEIARVALAFPADEQVLIMVETLEHALNLHKLLPEFTLVHYGSVSAERARRLGYSKDSLSIDKDKMDSYRSRFASGDLKKVIATMVWAEGVNFPGLSCLIRADGAPGEIRGEQIPGRLSRLSVGKDVGILIDFNDKFSPWAARRAAARMAFYRRRGWRTLPFSA